MLPFKRHCFPLKNSSFTLKFGLLYCDHHVRYEQSKQPDRILYLQASLNHQPTTLTVWNSMHCDGMGRTDHWFRRVILHMPQIWGPLVKTEKYIVIIVYVLFNTQFSINLFHWHQGSFYLLGTLDTLTCPGIFILAEEVLWCKPFKL